MIEKYIKEQPKPSAESVKSTQLLLDAALKRVNEEEAYTLNSSKNVRLIKKRAILEDNTKRKLIEVIDLKAEPKMKDGSIYPFENALYINAINQDEAGKPLSRGICIKVPKNEDNVSKTNIDCYPRLGLDEINQLADEITEAKRVDASRYSMASIKLGRRENEVMELL